MTKIQCPAKYVKMFICLYELCRLAYLLKISYNINVK